jgi:hypothetical protein
MSLYDIGDNKLYIIEGVPIKSNYTKLSLEYHSYLILSICSYNINLLMLQRVDQILQLSYDLNIYVCLE